MRVGIVTFSPVNDEEIYACMVYDPRHGQFNSVFGPPVVSNGRHNSEVAPV